MKLHEGESARMHLEVRGEGVITGADVIAPSEVEIVNPDLYLFTSDSSKTKLEIELTVERGRGYSPANDRSGKLPIGELPVDAQDALFAVDLSQQEDFNASLGMHMMLSEAWETTIEVGAGDRRTVLANFTYRF